MQVRSTIFTGAIVLALATATVSAQQPAAPRRYATVTYLKVLPGKAVALREFYTTGDGGKAIRAMMKANPKMLSWSLRQSMYAGNPAPEANYHILVGWEGAPTFLEPAKRDEVYKAATGTTFAQHQEKLIAMREVVGSAISHLHDTTGKLDQGDYVVAQRYKTTQGRTTELSNLMHDYRLPMVTENMKNGSLKFWAYSHLALSGGISQPWEATVTRAFKTLDDALSAGGPGSNPNGAGMRFAQLFPKKSYTDYQNEFREYATLVRTDVSWIAVMIRP